MCGSNQHRLGEEIGHAALSETAFARAMNLASGTLSVVDKNGVCFSRIWCELPSYLVLRLLHH